VVYTPERRHPVEVWADKEEAHLVQWLSRRLGHTVNPPPLSQAGFRLVGGRLVADDGGPAAQYMYEDARNRRVTLYVRRASDEGKTAFRFAEDRKVAAFYWIDGPLAYALIGGMPRDELLALARAVHRGLGGG
jgi:anti-sigma factor RsiW